MRRSVPLVAVLSIAALVALHTLAASPHSAAAPIPPGTLTPSATLGPGAAYLPAILREGLTPTPLPPTRPPTVPHPRASQTATPTSTPTTTPTSTPTPQITHTIDLSGTVYFRPQYRIIADGTCQPIEEDWTNRIDPDHAPDVPPPSGPLSYPTVGYLYLYGETGANHKVRIYQDAQLHHLRYLDPGLLAGTYTVRAFVGYKGDDEITRIYTRLFDSNTGQAYESIAIAITPSMVLGPVAALDFQVVLEGSVCP